MSKRIYNILFHAHTVSGILTAVALYVIFFAGTFSFFRDEIVAWERNEPVGAINLADLNLNPLLDTLASRKELPGRKVGFHRYYDERRIVVNLSAPATAEGETAGRGEFYYLDVATQDEYTYASNYSIGELLYRLHFFAQLNFFGRSGYILAGLVSFFFLFAIITGTLVHWNKIVSNFFVFRPGAKLKTLWTDMHTGLGLIGLPYQFVFALTGCFLIAGTLLMGPGISALFYSGDTSLMLSDLRTVEPVYPPAGTALNTKPDLNALTDSATARFEDFVVNGLEIHNYGDANMKVKVYGYPSYASSMTQLASIVYSVTEGRIVEETLPTQITYNQAAQNFMKRLHFGDYGGEAVRIIYFLLGILSCLVILSGIMIWLVARDKKNLAPAKRKFNFWMGIVFMAICLSMLPTTALTFLSVKLFFGDAGPERMHHLFQLFFYTWLALTVGFIALRNTALINKHSLLLAAVAGICIPFANGFSTGNWLWASWSAGAYRIFTIDLLWLLLSLAAFVAVLRVYRPKAEAVSLKS